MGILAEETLSDIMESLCDAHTNPLEDTGKWWDRDNEDVTKDIDQVVNDFLKYWRKHD